MGKDMDEEEQKRDKISMCHSPKRQRVNKSACVVSIGLLTNVVFGEQVMPPL